MVGTLVRKMSSITQTLCFNKGTRLIIDSCDSRATGRSSGQVSDSELQNVPRLHGCRASDLAAGWRSFYFTMLEARGDAGDS